MVVRFVCGASRRWRLGGLGRWRLGECPGKVWDRLEVCGGGNFRRGGVGFRLGLRRIPAKCRAISLRGVVGGIAGNLGEIGEGTLEDFGGVLGTGLLGEGEAEIRCFWVALREENGHALTRDSFWKTSSLFRDQFPFFSSLSLLKTHSQFPSLSA